MAYLIAAVVITSSVAESHSAIEAFQVQYFVSVVRCVVPVHLQSFLFCVLSSAIAHDLAMFLLVNLSQINDPKFGIMSCNKCSLAASVQMVIVGATFLHAK